MSKLRNNVIYQTAYNILAVCIPLITSPYLSRVLGAEGLGIYSYNYSIVSFFMLFALLGVGTYGMRAIAQSNGREEVSKNFFSIYAFQLISSALTIIAYLVFIAVFVKNEMVRVVSLIHILYVFGEAMNINWLFFGLEKYRTIVIRNIFIKLVTVAGIFIFVKKPEDIIVYILILAASAFLSNLVIWLHVKKCIDRVRITWKDVVVHIRPNILLFIPALAASMYHIMDKTMLGMFSDNANSGYYYNADKLLNIPLVVVTGCSSVFMTRTCNLIKDGDIKNAHKTQNESVYFGMCLISAIAFGICAVAEDFVPWFFGKGYDACIPLIKYFAAIIILKTISTHTRSVFLIPEREDALYAKAIICGAVVNLFANVVLIVFFRLGALGATVGTMIAEFVVVITQIIFMKKDRKRCIGGILQSMVYLLIGAIMFGVIFLIDLDVGGDFANLCVKVLVGVCVYVIECIVMWKICPCLMPDMVKETIVQVSNRFFKRATEK